MSEDISSGTRIKAQKKGLSSQGILASISIIVLYFIIAIILILDFTSTYSFFVRLGALFGFISMSIATILASDLRFVFKNFGKPFLKIHHIFAVFGVLFITIHPVVFAIEQMMITVFVPRFDSWTIFWELAGRPALYLIYLGTAVAILRRKIKNYWKVFHSLNYVALIFGYIHGVLIGTDFANPIIFAIFTGLILISLVVPFYKRFQGK